MTSLLSAVILGIVEGVTEFLPVSSTGHLILAGYLLDFKGPKAATFEIVIQLGAILSVVLIYWPRFKMLLTGDRRRFSGLRGIGLLCLTSLPASVVGLATHSMIKERLFGPQTVALALAVGAVGIILVESMRRIVRYEDLDDVTPRLALGIGVFQCLSLWPGFSRSASTILGGMLLGANRTLATEYSFIAAVPIMIAATLFEGRKSLPFFSVDDLGFLAVGFVVSFVFAWLAVKWFIRLVSHMDLRPFAYYRLALAPLVWLFWPTA